MRKLQQIAFVVAAAGGLAAGGAGSSSAVTPVAFNGAVPPPVSQPDAQATTATSAQATTQSYGSPAVQQPAPAPASQRGTQVAPQLNPQLNPQINPQLSSPAPQTGQTGQTGRTGQSVAPAQNNLFRPAQECSPQSLLDANVPVAVLAASQTRGIECTQANSQSNALSSAFANAR
ncbi:MULTISPECIES: hypothetical protein [Streptomyces]|uniref:Uncharacterized protein n=1 Tax=Streptomyces doebereineriae TaxID=3075528 RepID=A0ABU2VNP2_9ACTN|nr:hypothetical protein [Streptomyces sp. DSM 41640]MDT0486944.1 hypothetical protein [Streptomyces sp. DSM 41640]